MDGMTSKSGTGPMPGPLQQLAHSAWQILMAIAVASFVLGLIVLTWPHATLHVVGVIFGLYLLISGIAQVAASFGTHAETSMRVLAFVSGVEGDADADSLLARTPDGWTSLALALDLHGARAVS